MEYKGNPSRDTIWDFTGADVSLNNSNDMKEIVHYSKSIIHSREGGKTAIVSPEDFTFRMCRIYQAFAEIEKYIVPMAVFRSIQEAEWIFSEEMDNQS